MPHSPLPLRPVVRLRSSKAGKLCKDKGALAPSISRVTALALSMATLAFVVPAAYAQQAASPSSQAIAPSLPVSHNAGPWKAGHVQGIAVDQQRGFIYYSFTSMLAKYDFSGNLIGTVDGIAGHLGDLVFNPEDGNVYGSLEYKDDNAFYIAVVDGDRINRVGIPAQSTDVFKTVYLPEVTKDYAADLDGDGVFDGNTGATADHRYGTSGIDGVSFGPPFGQPDNPHLLTVAYGVYPNTNRSDNDHQVLLQYAVTDWARLAEPLQENNPHRSGPQQHDGKYFVYTGHTTYGVQNLSYDAYLQRWFLGVYKGQKTHFPNYALYAVEAASQPVIAPLAGVPTPSGAGDEYGRLLPLAEDGLTDSATGIRGWMQKADMGFQPLGHGLYYIAQNSRADSLESAALTLVRWTGNPDQPFAPVDPKGVLPK